MSQTAEKVAKTPAAVLKAAYHAASAVHLDVGFCAHHVGGQRYGEIHGRTHRHVGVHMKQHAVRGDIVRLYRVPAGYRFECDRKLDGKTRRTLHIRVTLAALARFHHGFFAYFRHGCENLPSL